MSTSKLFSISKLGLLSACVAAALSTQAQEAVQEEEVYIIGSYSDSLKRALDLKRNSKDFTDSITAEDVGKFPDNNLAEALQRIPGVQITRTNGEGQQIAMRGMGASFTRVLLDGLPISVASQGGVEQGSRSREFDFDIFPSELFTTLEVRKTARASQAEGGLAGTINLRTGRPFDFDGLVVSGSLQASYADSSGETDPRGSFMISNTWNDKFGVLVAGAVSSRTYQTEGTTTIEWDRGRVDNPATVDVDYPDGGNQWNTESGNNSGYSDSELNQIFTPRLARPDFQLGTRERTGLNVAFQFRPSDTLNLNLDVLSSNLTADFERFTNNHLVRNTGPGSVFGYIEPVDFEADQNWTLTSGTFVGSQFWSENRVYKFDTNFMQSAFSGNWTPSELTKLEFYVSKNTSDHDVTHTTLLFMTQPLTNRFENVGGYPQITPNVDIADAQYWRTDHLRVQPFTSEEENDNVKIDFTFGTDSKYVKLGIHKHEFTRDYQNKEWTESQTAFLEWANSTQGTSFSDSNNDGTLDFADLDASVYGQASPSFGGNLDTSMGYDRWLTADFDAWGVNWEDLDARTPQNVTGADFAQEESVSYYIEGNYAFDIGDGREININGGLRNSSTDNVFGALVETDNGVIENNVEGENSTTLPTLAISIDASEDVKIRMAAGRAMTRQSPTDMRPNTSVGISGDITQGNPSLEPYFSTYFDMGFEWYFQDQALLSGSFFNKKISGFIIDVEELIRFGDAGINPDTFDPAILAALPNGLDTRVAYRTKINGPDEQTVSGFELQYQQPLDMIVEGLGIVANSTLASSDTEVQGLSKSAYNFVTYFERENFMVRMAYNYRSDYNRGTSGRFSQERAQEAAGYLDFSSSYTLPFSDLDIELTFEALNLTNEQERAYIGESNRLWELYKPGSMYLLGVRAKF